MNWFNYYGLAIMALIMIPNIIYAVKHKDEQADAYKNKTAEIFEQIGRYACFAFIIFNVPYTYLGFYFSSAETVYIVVNSILVLAYLLIWIITWKKSGIAKALLLSIIPSIIFLFSGIMIVSAPLMAFAIIFAVNHILISVKTATLTSAN